MPVCGGLRKMRVADPRRGKGKWGGIRVIYPHIDEVDQIHLVTIHGKDQKDDLSADDNNSYRELVRILNDQSRESIPTRVPAHELYGVESWIALNGRGRRTGNSDSRSDPAKGAKRASGPGNLEGRVNRASRSSGLARRLPADDRAGDRVTKFHRRVR